MSITVREAVLKATGLLRAARVAGPQRDAALLLAETLDEEPDILYRDPDRVLSGDEKKIFDALVARRTNREPLSHIAGKREFWSLEFLVGPDVLDPRPDSETLVQAALDAVKAGQKVERILDLGTGSGCLLLALLSELPEVEGLGIDVSEAAVRVATENADRLGLASRARFQTGDWNAGLGGRFDLVVSNPPYISDADMKLLQPEVRLYEPSLALRGGVDGLDCYRRIITGLDEVLNPGGLALFEVGAGQAAEVSKLLAEAGFVDPVTARDLAGIDRCVGARERKI